jgi:TolB-like protein/DNA-binding winged helix-turn-helix (wHTH) protein/tetratricopeptide (TPR) repeat protein
VHALGRQVVRFGVFEVDLQAGEVRKQGLRLRLQEQPFKVLVSLLERPGAIITREELRQRLWPQDTFVDFDHGLNAAAGRLRQVLGDSAETPRFVETVPRQGYRFIAPIELVSTEATPKDPGCELAGAAFEASASESKGAPPVRRITFTRHITLVTAVSVVVLAMVAGWLAIRSRAASKLSLSIRSVAVLPLDNLSADSQQEYFSDGMTDQIIASLSRINALRVISRTSVMQYKRVHKALPAVAKDLNVDAIVEGSVSQSNGRVRVSARLVRAQSESNIWEGTFERDLKDVLALQTEIAWKIAQEIRVTIDPNERSRMVRSIAVDPELHQLYLKGRFYANTGSEEGLNRAVATFDKVIERDPNYAPAYAGLADAWSNLASVYLPPREVMPKAKAAALKALQLDKDLDASRAQLGFIAFFYDWDWVTAESQFKRAIELNPNSADGHDGYANLAAALGRVDDAVREIRIALALDPLSLRVQGDAIFVFLDARRYDDAIEQARKALEIEPHAALLWAALGMVHGQKGELKKAIDDFETAARIERTPTVLGFLAHGYALAGNKARAQNLLRELTEIASRRYVCPFEVTTAYSSLGLMDEAFDWMHKGVAHRADCMTWLRTEPWLDRLRSDPRYPELLRLVGLPDSVASADAANRKSPLEY